MAEFPAKRLAEQTKTPRQPKANEEFTENFEFC